MKRALAKFLLSRSVGKVQDVLSKLLRNGLVAVGSYTAGQGAPISDPDMGTLSSAGAILIGVGLSLARTFVAEKLTEEKRP